MQSRQPIQEYVPKNDIQVICSSHYLLLKLYWKRIHKKNKKKDIHAFRVIYKKLEAYFTMLNSVTVQPAPLKISKKIRDAYHLLGKIRNLQLQLVRCKEDSIKKIKNKYLHKTRKEIRALEQQLEKSFSSQMLLKNWQNNFKRLPGAIGILTVSKYLTETWDRTIVKAEPGKLSDDQIHALRKALKTLYYNVSLLRTHLFMSSPAEIIRNANTGVLLELLGQYQDICSAIEINSHRFQDSSEMQLQTLVQEQQSLKEKIIRQVNLVNKTSSDFCTAALREQRNISV